MVHTHTVFYVVFFFERGEISSDPMALDCISSSSTLFERTDSLASFSPRAPALRAIEQAAGEGI